MHRSVFAISVRQLMQHIRFMKQLNKTVSVWIGMASALIGRWDIQRHFERANQKRTGLILDFHEDFIHLSNTAPVAPHFRDFVIGLPAAVENTAAALQAGSTSIGNLGQYFTFELPGWTDDVKTTDASITAISLASTQRVPNLIH